MIFNLGGGSNIDLSVITAEAAHVLINKIIVDSEGNPVVGTMLDNGAVEVVLDTSTLSYNIQKGYHNGQGKVSIVTETQTVSPSTSDQTILPTSGRVLSKVVVKAMTGIEQATPTISIDTTGKITASVQQAAGFVSAGTKTATKQMTVQAAKTVTPTLEEQTVVGSGVYTTGAVKVAAMPTATQATPTISIDSAGKITASATQSAGYVAAGTKSATKQLTTQGAKTVTPTTNEQTVVGSGVYTTGAVKVAAIQTETKNVTPSTSAQTITPTSGKYLTKVSVEGDSNLVAANIRSGKSIFGVSGTLKELKTVGGSISSTVPFNITLSGWTKIQRIFIIADTNADIEGPQFFGSPSSDLNLTKGGSVALRYNNFSFGWLGSETGANASFSSTGVLTVTKSDSSYADAAKYYIVGE